MPVHAQHCHRPSTLLITGCMYVVMQCTHTQPIHAKVFCARGVGKRGGNTTREFQIAFGKETKQRKVRAANHHNSFDPIDVTSEVGYQQVQSPQGTITHPVCVWGVDKWGGFGNGFESYLDSGHGPIRVSSLFPVSCVLQPH